MKSKRFRHAAALMLVVVSVIGFDTPGRAYLLNWARGVAFSAKAHSPEATRREPVNVFETADPKLMINVGESPKKYQKNIEAIIALLNKHPGLPRDGGSRFPPSLLKPGATFSERAPWDAENHFVFLTNVEGDEIYGWSKIQDRMTYWRVEYVWINRKFRKLGLGRYILGYIESLCQYGHTRGWDPPRDLRLLSGGVDAFYDKLGYKKRHSGGMYIRDGGSQDAACTHSKILTEGSKSEFKQTHELVAYCRNGSDEDDHFHTHVVHLPPSYSLKIDK